MREIYFSQFWGLEVKDGCSSRLGVWRQFTFWFIEGYVLTMSPHGERGEEALWGPLYKATNPIYGGSTP